jgi:transcriptional regulator of heat shock response
VGSKTLVSQHLPGISPATVRNELMWLEDKGYVTSLHTSSGRVPTTYGYRSFVNNLLLQPLPELRSRKAEFLSPGYTIDCPDSLSMSYGLTQTVKSLSEHVTCLALIWMPSATPVVYHRGLTMLVSQPEFSDTSALLPLIRLLEDARALGELLEGVMDSPGLHIRIGSENRHSQLGGLALVAVRILVAAHPGVLALLAPTRMDYRRAISALSPDPRP